MTNMEIWDREFELEVVFDCYKGEEILPKQRDALALFCSDKKMIKDSRSEVEKYCIERDSDKIKTTKIDNIFKYVIPETIYIARDGRVALMCRYRFDVDHGIAIVFKDGKLEEIGNQDIVL